MGQISRIALLALISAVFAVICGLRLDVVERGEAWLYDIRVRAAAHEGATPPEIVVVEISDEDIAETEKRIGVPWPWPRELQAALVDTIAGAGAKAILVDLVYPDRGMLVAAEDDEVFADVLRASPTVIGATGLAAATKPERPPTGPWFAPVRQYGSRPDALSAAARLTTLRERVFVASAPPFRLYMGGQKSKEALLAAWEGTAAVAAVADLFDGRTFSALRDVDGVEEVTRRFLLRERFGRMIHGAEGLLDVVVAAPQDLLVSSAHGVGIVSQTVAGDSAIRGVRHFFRDGDRVFPSLAMAGYLVGNPDAELEIGDDEAWVGSMRIPLDDRGNTLLRFRARERFERVLAYNVLASAAEIAAGETPRIDMVLFRDKYVVISPSARGLGDRRPSPLYKTHPGGDINAEALSNLLSGRFVERASRELEVLLTFALCFSAGLVVLLLIGHLQASAAGLPVSVLAGAAVLGAYGLGSSVGYSQHDLWVATTLPTLGGAATVLSAVIAMAAVERKERRFVQDALGRYTSDVLVAELMAHPEKLSLKFGEKTDVSVYFSDIAGFTTISEGMDPEQLVAFLNDYLTEMTDIVLEEGGIVDKYIGDAVMAFWGAPLSDPSHARHAVRAALKMKRATDEHRQRWQDEYGHALHVRAGVNSGVAVTGNMGSKHKYNYTVMGDMVNLAARLEGANKPYGTDLMVSEATFRAVEDLFHARELDAIAVKGKTEPVRVFEILAGKEETDVDLRFVERFQAGLSFYREQVFTEAIACFEDTLRLRPEDGPARAFIQRCMQLSEDPPGSGWDGVWRMEEK